MKKLGTSLFICGVLGLAGAAIAQDAKPAGAPPPMPKPGPAHAIFQEVAGTWDAKVETWMAPGEPMVSTGTEVVRLGCGGLCLITDFKGSMMGGVFEGHGTEVYDSAKKKYVGTWTDSMSTGMSITESTHDAATKTMTGTMEGPDMTGKVMKMKGVTVMKDANTRVFSMYNAGPDGKDVLGMRITYTRKKEVGKTTP